MIPLPAQLQTVLAARALATPAIPSIVAVQKGAKYLVAGGEEGGACTNGVYQASGSHNGRPRYSNLNGYIQWENGQGNDWAFHNLGTPGVPKWTVFCSGHRYYAEVDTAIPPVNGWTARPQFAAGTITVTEVLATPASSPAAGGSDSSSVTVCRFGVSCARAGCWFQHPQGRVVDADPSKGLCRYGADCQMFNCFRVHPDSRKVSPPKDVSIHIDELTMAGRPEAEPTTQDREVFIDPLPGDDGSAEMKDFLAAFGAVEDVYQLPDQPHARGYVRFKDHASALSCVNSGAGVWSESERGLNSDKRAIGYDCQSAYNESLVVLLAGQDGESINQLAEQAGVRYMRLNAGGFNARKFGVSDRLHFTCKATEAQFLELKAGLEVLLTAAYQKLVESHASSGTSGDAATTQEKNTLWVGNLPADAAEEDLRALGEMAGEVKEVRMGGEGGKPAGYAFIEYGNPAEAQLAMDQLKDYDYNGNILRLDLAAPLLKRKNADDPLAFGRRTVFVGNIPSAAKEAEIWEIFGRVGPVSEVRFKADKGWSESTGQGTSIAFVDYQSSSDVTKALEDLKDVTLHGLKLRLHLEERGGMAASSKFTCVSRISPPRSSRGSSRRDRSPRNFRDKDERTVFVGNVPEEAGEADLRDIFERAGVISSLNRLIGKGIAFVEYDTPDDAQRCVDTLKEERCCGQRLRLERKGEPKRKRSRSARRNRNSECTLFVGNIPENAGEDDLREIFEAAGTISSLDLLSGKGVAFIEYTNAEDCGNAAELMKDVACKGQTLRVQRKNDKRDGQKKSKENCKIFLGHVPDEATEADLRDVFEPAGPITHVHIIPGKGVAFVEFANPDDCQVALDTLSDAQCLGKELRVRRYESEHTAGDNPGDGGRSRRERDRNRGDHRDRREQHWPPPPPGDWAGGFPPPPPPPSGYPGHPQHPGHYDYWGMPPPPPPGPPPPGTSWGGQLPPARPSMASHLADEDGDSGAWVPPGGAPDDTYDDRDLPAWATGSDRRDGDRSPGRTRSGRYRGDRERSPRRQHRRRGESGGGGGSGGERQRRRPEFSGTGGPSSAGGGRRRSFEGR